ncbi:MAG: 30S ribosomal protein S6 [Chloroflexota bacterium]
MVTRDKKTARSKKVAVRKPIAAADKELRGYEMVLVFSPELAEDKFNAALDDISKHITNMGGVISDIKLWGKRKLAYPIKHFSEGNYVLTQFQLQPAAGKEIEAKLIISEDVLRHLLVRLNN